MALEIGNGGGKRWTDVRVSYLVVMFSFFSFLIIIYHVLFDCGC